MLHLTECSFSLISLNWQGGGDVALLAGGLRHAEGHRTDDD